MKRDPALESADGLDIRAPVPEVFAWGETLIVTAAAIAVSAWTDVVDPFRLHSGFPWPLIGPVLAGLRYGFAHGFVSALLVAAALGFAINQGWQGANSFPLAYAIGCVVIGMLCGEFRDAWQRRLTRLAGANAYRRERLEEFTRSYHLLRVSHDRLEQTLAGPGHSLREALSRLQQQVKAGSGLTEDAAQAVLQLAADHVSIQQAAIFPVNAHGLLNDEAVATLGNVPAMNVRDPLIQRCLSERALIAIGPDQRSLDVARDSAWQVVVPLIDSAGQWQAMMAIAAMPFFALHQGSLQLLNVIAAHAADRLVGATPETPSQTFAREVSRALLDAERYQLPATLLFVSVAQDADAESLSRLRRERRALDQWREVDARHAVLLLPLTETTQADALLQRLGDARAALRVEAMAIDSSSAAKALLDRPAASA